MKNQETEMDKQYLYTADLHTHTIASGHAKNTIKEMVESARSRGLKLYGITDHGVTMPGTCNEEYFSNLCNEKKDYFEDIEVLLGVELNIIDYDGSVDMPEEDLKKMDLTIASIHNTIGYTPGTKEQNTSAYIGAMKNPYVNIIGHPDDGRIEIDYEKLVLASKEYKTLLELNNNSISCGFRLNARENDIKMLKLCKKYEVPIVIGSDAHNTDNISKNSDALELVKETGFDKNMILNYNLELLKTYLNKYKL